MRMQVTTRRSREVTIGALRVNVRAVYRMSLVRAVTPDTSRGAGRATIGPRLARLRFIRIAGVVLPGGPVRLAWHEGRGARLEGSFRADEVATSFPAGPVAAQAAGAGPGTAWPERAAGLDGSRRVERGCCWSRAAGQRDLPAGS